MVDCYILKRSPGSQFMTAGCVCMCITALIFENFECKKKNIFLSIRFNICFGCSKELSYGGHSFEISVTYVLCFGQDFFFNQAPISRGLGKNHYFKVFQLTCSGPNS